MMVIMMIKLFVMVKFEATFFLNRRIKIPLMLWIFDHPFIFVVVIVVVFFLLRFKLFPFL